MPLQTTRVIPEGWAAHHFPVTEGGMTAVCQITRDGEGESVFDPETGNTVAPPRVEIYTGPCRVRFMSDIGNQIVAADQGIVNADYMVSVEQDAEFIRAGEYGDRVEFTEVTEGDLQLLDLALWVEAILHTSLRWDRVFFCSENQNRTNQQVGG